MPTNRKKPCPNAIKYTKDMRLSYEARGLLSTVNDLGDKWKFSREGLLKISPCKKDKLDAILKELKKYGYLQIRPVRGYEGKFENDWTWNMYVTIDADEQQKNYTSPVPENPVAVSNPPYTDNPVPVSASPVPENPVAVKAHKADKHQHIKSQGIDTSPVPASPVPASPVPVKPTQSYINKSISINNSDDDISINQSIIQTIETEITHRGLTAREREDIEALITEYGIDTVIHATERAYNAGGKSIAYIRKCAESASNGKRAVHQAQAGIYHTDSHGQKVDSNGRYAPTYDIAEIERMLDEEWIAEHTGGASQSDTGDYDDF